MVLRTPLVKRLKPYAYAVAARRHHVLRRERSPRFSASSRARVAARAEGLGLGSHHERGAELESYFIYKKALPTSHMCMHLVHVCMHMNES